MFSLNLMVNFPHSIPKNAINNTPKYTIIYIRMLNIYKSKKERENGKSVMQGMSFPSIYYQRKKVMRHV